MGYNERTVGGGAAKGLGKDFTSFLQNFINTGSFGAGTSGQQGVAADPMADTQGIFGLLNSLVSNPTADKAVQGQLEKDQGRNVNQIRSRFGAGGGTAFGSPGAFAENQYRAESTPEIAKTMDEMGQNRLAALMPLFQQAFGLAGKGIPQAETMMEPDALMQGLNIGSQVASIGANLFAPGAGALVGAAGNAAMNGMAPKPGVTPIGMPSANPIGRGAQPILKRPQPYDFSQQLYN